MKTLKTAFLWIKLDLSGKKNINWKSLIYPRSTKSSSLVRRVQLTEKAAAALPFGHVSKKNTITRKGEQLGSCKKIILSLEKQVWNTNRECIFNDIQPITWQHTLQSEGERPSSEPWCPNCKNISTQWCKCVHDSSAQNSLTKPITVTNLSVASTCLQRQVKDKIGFPSETLWLWKCLDQSSSAHVVHKEGWTIWAERETPQLPTWV